MRLISILRTAIVILPLMTTWAEAADESGQYSVRGAGLLSCEVFTRERAQQTDAYRMIGGWIDGYVTAVNANRPETYDIATYQSTEMISEIMDRHCRLHPQQRLFSVVTAIAERLHAQRVVNASPRQLIVVAGMQTHLYNDTVTRMQIALAEQGLIQHAAVNGQFDKPTAAALAAFQAQRAFKPTGFPDQATLWLLFQGGDSRS